MRLAVVFWIVVLIGCTGTSPTTRAQGVCVTKEGTGSGSDEESARLQAWEAVLQATDMLAWSAWVTKGAGGKFGEVPSYSVSDVRQRCESPGYGRRCTVQAQLCKK